MSYRLLVQATRVGLYAMVIGLVVTSHLVQDGFFNWLLMKQFYSVAAAGLLIHLAGLLWLEKLFQNRKALVVSFISDAFLFGSLMMMTGLNQTLFSFLFLIVVLLSGLVLQTSGALFVASFCSLAFSLAAWLDPSVKALPQFFIWTLNNISFFVVAVLSGYLSQQLNLFQEKLEAQNLSLGMIRRLNEMIIQTIPSGLLTVNSLGQILQFNPGAAQLFGKEDLAGSSLYDLLPSMIDHVQHFSEIKSSKKVEVPQQRSGGAGLLELQLLVQESDLEVPTFLVIIEDLTEKRQMELAVRQSEKMAAIGGLAAGIAHEIRNPLAGISGSIELLSQNFSSEDDKKLGKIILREIDRLNRLISEFLEYSKPEKPPTDSLKVQELLQEVLNQALLSLPPERQKQLQIKTQLQETSLIYGHKDKLKQAFLNIVINAIQAMEKRPEMLLEVRVRESEQNVWVVIQDHGAGMSAETQKRMFEPFHTTKSKGTGLGLAVTHKILQGHRAQIFVQSEVGVGTEFQMSFPAARIDKSVDNKNRQAENKMKEDIS